MDFNSHPLLAECGPTCRGLGSDRSTQYRKVLLVFLEVFGHLLPFRAAFSTFSSLESTNPQGTDISKGETEGETSGLQQSPVRAEAAEGRRDDSKERKGEKEGKDRERKVSLGWKVLHTFGLPRKSR